MRQILGVYSAPRPHWVGDGFPVRTMLSHHDQGSHVSPFVMLDYAGPATFEPTTARRGVGAHPHKGFETVTIVYEGEVEHRDSTGAGGTIGPGDVQWMTAASGIVHEEFHAPGFAREGGLFEVIQLWVNLPARHKMDAPGYQPITSADIPRVDLADGAGSVRVIAGSFNGTAGPARTYTPINLWDVRLMAGARAEFDLPAGHTAGVFVLRGRIRLGNGESVADAHIAVLERDGSRIVISADEDTTLLLLGGAPIDEPVVGYGPFVMNTQQEVRQAIADYQNGKMGHIARRV